MFRAKILSKPGGYVRRSIASLPRNITVAMIRYHAFVYGFGFRIDHDQVVVFS
jgi:hypothetical protein